ncbi:MULTISPECIES: TetR/AcrR family transcriptional regulator [Xanthomonas]|uniref:TetR/AcrR family transcriptional regulator n=1 Tax=Xanthomonas TaxID=338 RepID=UPI00036C2C3F|nr:MULTISPECIES: TetR/AcrR family transcriptional regulator [Xanthomonas]KAB7777587.1 TetR/AcrR family transcriptional regulator [Xanthomonas sp. LMG 12459]UYK82183.1 TetR/AcrR family transcriptional regulator [Xanthomonas sacchari]
MKMDTRARIVAEADRLFYAQGYAATSFADVADAVGISRGNFYHHFKSKDAILDAVIALRLERTQAMLQGWEDAAVAPADGIRQFIQIVVRNQASIMRHGCPVGSLCGELSKLEHPAQAQATQLFGLFRQWLRRQFERLGRSAEADALAMHVLAFSQGVAVLAQAFGDADFVQREVGRMQAWLDAVAAAPAAT